MRRYTESRYIPYVRVRYRTRSSRSYPVNMSFQNIMIFMRYIMCIICLVLTLNNIGNKYDAVVSSITENNVVNFINDYIDRGVLETKKSYKDNDFIIIQKNSNNKILSIKNDVVKANLLASLLSEKISLEIKRIEYQDMKMYSDIRSFFQNGILTSLMMNVPFKVVPDGKVNITPEFTVENLNTNQKIHRLEMRASVKIKILFPLHREEKLITRAIVISETIISE